jgi:hypothetical protein
MMPPTCLSPHQTPPLQDCISPTWSGRISMHTSMNLPKHLFSLSNAPPPKPISPGVQVPLMLMRRWCWTWVSMRCPTQHQQTRRGTQQQEHPTWQVGRYLCLACSSPLTVCLKTAMHDARVPSIRCTPVSAFPPPPCHTYPRHVGAWQYEAHWLEPPRCPPHPHT